IFAGAVWLGGQDPGGNLKIAAQTYGRGSGEFDFYPGPLNEGDPDHPNGPLGDPNRGTVGRDTCAQWDRFFTVSGKNVDQHVRRWRTAEAAGQTSLDPNTIPEDILGWPARNNEFFEGIHQFRLPSTQQGLAGFWDQDFDGNYEPDEGDYPIIEIRGCTTEEPLSAPDEMIFWVYNDAGNDHRESGSALKLQMEVQVQAFSYATNDDINNMTFQRYKLINRSVERLDSTYFAVWVDADLGCYTDDYVGCDVERSLAYVYNADSQDGTTGCICDQGVETYCDEIPILGVDYFRGPLDEFGEEIGMSSFTYANNGSQNPTPPPGTTDPNTPQEYYNYLSGRWRDGSSFQFGGDAYQTGGEDIPYAFIDPPNDPDGWSMAAEGLPVGDRRTIQASGQFTLFPGAINELIIGVVWVPDQDYPNPAITRLQRADDIAQDLFDNCFNLTRGPDAPDVAWIELDQELIAVLTNDDLTSNNAFEQYQEPGLGIPDGVDSLYRFEGYKLFQLSGPDVSLADQGDPDKVRLVFQVDRVNDITKVFNWEGLNPADNETPTAELYFVPELQVDGENEGIRHTFRITEDQFASGNDRRLINHRKYYFAAVAYAYNNYKEFDPAASGDRGQETPYLEGDGNIGDTQNGTPFYTVIPRMILDRQLQARYGDGPAITRIDGVGTGENFLDLADETRKELEDLIRADDAANFGNEITYANGSGPIDVLIYNPLDVIDGDYELTFMDDDMSNKELDLPTVWTLRSLSDPGAPVITAEKPISDPNEQIIREFGLSINIFQVAEPGPEENEDGVLIYPDNNGLLGYDEVYASADVAPWFFGLPDNLQINTGNPAVDAAVFDYIDTDDPSETEFDDDPDRTLTEGGSFVPYHITNWRPSPTGTSYLTPAWVVSGNRNNIVHQQTGLDLLNNVDIVFTSDKSLWSRCVIVETANPAYGDAGFLPEGDRNMFDLRAQPSVSKEADPTTGLPIPDAETAAGEVAGEENGMGWFPGYAVDVETGQRLNIFFGENSVYNGFDSQGNEIDGPTNGGDMMYNPTSEFFLPAADGSTNVTEYNFPVGGQHFIYVTDYPYDRCAELLDRLGDGSALRKVQPLKRITWTSVSVLPPGRNMLSYADGLIPNDLTVKLRVNNSYQVKTSADEDGDPTFEGEFGGYPAYRFSVEGQQALELDEMAVNEALQAINVIPNPYYGFSEYEDSQFETIVKISNLPAEATITIYSLDGKFIRKYERNETGQRLISENSGIESRQINPDLEWDMKNFRGIPIASGVYLIHVTAPGIGERTLKWFGVNRQFDPSGL
ncbi:MAG: hypothetical protein AAGJ82_07250, partial [Bacteroidota bacterium]